MDPEATPEGGDGQQQERGAESEGSSSVKADAAAAEEQEAPAAPPPDPDEEGRRGAAPQVPAPRGRFARSCSPGRPRPACAWRTR